MKKTLNTLDWTKAEAVHAGAVRNKEDTGWNPLIEVDGDSFVGAKVYSSLEEAGEVAVVVLYKHLEDAGVVDKFDYFGTAKSTNDTTH